MIAMINPLSNIIHTQNVPSFEIKPLRSEYDYIAPDTSEIRLLTTVKGGGLSHVTLPPRRTSEAHVHMTVDEQWYFIGGLGQVWLKDDEEERIIDVMAGVSLTIPKGIQFQFRNLGWEPLCFLCVDTPPWPGADEAQPVQGHWKTLHKNDTIVDGSTNEL
jgi:mannose-6-phosphate isomerase-like protein (cupin superfamily)